MKLLPSDRRSRTVVLVAGLVAVAVLVTGVVVVLARTRGSPENVAAQYLAAWERGDHAATRELVLGAPDDFADQHARIREDLGVTGMRLERGAADERDDATVIDYTATLTLRGAADWTYDGRLRLVPHEREWRVDWSPASLHPDLEEGQRLRRETDWPQREAVVAADGERLDSGNQPGSIQQLVGTLGPATEEDVERLGQPYEEGDQVGRSGLQRAYERRLAGKPAVAIQVVAEDTEEDAEEDGEPIREVAELEGEPGQPLRTTIDPDVQAAASGALSDFDNDGKPTALVAVRPSSGEVLAVANKPGGFDRALAGRYPPGSTFKVITAAALVSEGVSPDDRVGCPDTTQIAGRTFRNYEDEGLGTVSFHTAFARSCNTTFATLAAERLGDGRLDEVAGSFGFDAPLTPGLPASPGQFPTPGDSAGLAAAALGQGQVLASPLHMATVAGAVSAGTWQPPRLVSDVPLGGGSSGDGGSPSPEPTAPRDLDPEVVDVLRQLMPAVVTEGTAESVDFPDGVAGKTGTAEYGSAEDGEDPPTHAWFIGYTGGADADADAVAFAVVVEGGGVGAEVAGPVAADFLRRR